MTMNVEPTGAATGARITGVDISQALDADTIAVIHQAWMDHQVLIFPNQEMTEDEQIRFARLWGEFPVRDRFEGRPEKDVADKSIMLISNIREGGKPIGSLPDGEMMFHTDGEIDKFKPGIERMLKETPVPVIPMALRGLWGSFFSHKEGVFKHPSRFWSRVDVVAGTVLQPEALTADALQARVADLRGEAA